MWQIRRIEQTSSTNDDVKSLFATDSPEGLVIVANHQTAGRGCSGPWLDTPGGTLLFTLLLRPQCPLEAQKDLLQLSAEVMKETLDKMLKEKGVLADHDVALKWPNDILFNGRKICGILQESQSEGNVLRNVALGLGLNVNITLDDLQAQGLLEATSLAQETHMSWQRESLLLNYLKNFEDKYTLFKRETQSSCAHGE